MAKKKEITIRSSAAEYLTYAASVGDQPFSVELRYEDENIWLTQRLMAELYGVEKSTISEHVAKIFSDGELEESATVRNFRTVQQEGERMVTRDLVHFNLQMIIAVGFKVNNERAVQFRKWANSIVKEYTIKGWVMDDVRLKEGGFRLPGFGRKHGASSYSHDHGRLGNPSQWIPHLIESRCSGRCRQGKRRNGQNPR